MFLAGHNYTPFWVQNVNITYINAILRGHVRFLMVMVMVKFHSMIDMVSNFSFDCKQAYYPFKGDVRNNGNNTWLLGGSPSHNP